MIKIDDRTVEDESIELSADGTELTIDIRFWSNAVKLEDNQGGSYYYFRSLQEIEDLRDMLNKVLEIKPTIDEDQPS